MMKWGKYIVTCLAISMVAVFMFTSMTSVSLARAADSGEAQLFQAIFKGDKAAVETYLKEEKSLNVVGKKNMSPLLYAISMKRKDIAVLLIEKGADVNFTRKPSDETPLFYGAGHGFTGIVELLLQKGAALEARDRFGWTPLTAAVFAGHTDTVKLLLANKADTNHVDNSGISPLMYAAQKGEAQIVELLLANGADPFLKDEDGKTAIQYAGDEGHTDIVKLLTPKPPK